MYGIFRALLLRFVSDRSAVTAVEYGVIAAAIVVGIVALVFTVGDDITAAFQTVSDELNANLPAAP